nr:LamG domain-containing protein [Luteolibacter marinus]
MAFFITDGSFAPGNGADILGAAGVTQIGSTFSVTPAAADGTGYRSGSIDLTGLDDGTEIWVRFAGNGGSGQFAPFDDLSFFQPGADFDGDGLSDEDEILLGTDSQNRDTDGDGLEDGEEVNDYHTDPLEVDTDWDLYSDGDEVAAGTDPLNFDKFPAFTGNGAIRLDGRSHLSFSPEAGVIPSGNQPFTIELWANPETLNAEELGGSTFVFWGEEATRQANGFRLSGSSVLRHYFWGDDSVVETGSPFANDNGGPNSDGWHHFAVSYDGSKVVIILNGLVVDTSLPATPVSVTDANHMIGRKLSDTFGAGFYHGYLDEIRIWNTARSLAEIRANLGSGLQGTEPGLIACWNFDGTLEDSTTNGIHLYPVGGVTYELENHAPLGISVEFPAPVIRFINRDTLTSTTTLTWSSLAGQIYHVDRSEDLEEWGQIGEVQGNESETTFTDSTTTSGRQFYRVRE